MVIENVRQLRHDVDDSCPIGPDGKRQHTYDYREGGCRQVKNAEVSANLGWAMPGTGSAMVMRRGEGATNMITAELPRHAARARRQLDHENRDYFAYCAKHEFRLQRCCNCQLFRYPPQTACPWCTEAKSDWVPVEGKGTVHSYTEVHHAIQPAFKKHVPYLILLVELDTQSGKPTPQEALARDRQPDDAGRRARPEGGRRPRRHRHAHAHGVFRRRAGAVAAAVDDRRGRRRQSRRLAV